MRLIAMTDADFGWLFGETRRDDLILVDGGIGSTEIVSMLRGIAATLGGCAAHPVAWLIVAADEAVGMISFTRLGEDGRFEVGYGVAPSREGRGHASAALAALIVQARAIGLRGLTAGTSPANRGSQRVLEKNGFVPTGMRVDAEDGELVCWAYDLKATA